VRAQTILADLWKLGELIDRRFHHVCLAHSVIITARVGHAHVLSFFQLLWLPRFYADSASVSSAFREKVFRGESPDCQTVIEGLDARTEKRVSVGISYTNCALSTCFAPQTAASCAADDERTSAWEGLHVHHGLSVLWLT